MSQSVVGLEKAGELKPVLAQFDDAWYIAFEVERIEGGYVTVFIPGAPNRKGVEQVRTVSIVLKLIGFARYQAQTWVPLNRRDTVAPAPAGGYIAWWEILK